MKRLKRFELLAYDTDTKESSTRVVYAKSRAAAVHLEYQLLHTKSTVII